jgi:hypothetical protein
MTTDYLLLIVQFIGLNAVKVRILSFFFAGLVVNLCHYRCNKVGPLERRIGILYKNGRDTEKHGVFEVNFIVDW